jgi:hypothetical protein
LISQHTAFTFFKAAPVPDKARRMAHSYDGTPPIAIGIHLVLIRRALQSFYLIQPYSWQSKKLQKEITLLFKHHLLWMREELFAIAG